MEDFGLDDSYFVESAVEFVRRENFDEIQILMKKCSNCGEFRPKDEIKNNLGECNLCHSNENLKSHRHKATLGELF